MNTLKYIFFLFILTATLLHAQSLRGLVNDGVDEYEESKFAEAEVNFKKGIESNLESFEPRFNLGDAIYKQGRYEEALEEFKNSAALAKTDNEKSSIFHNIGNTFIKSQKLQESIAAYKEALKLNPNDMETKYNLSYALKQMQNQQDNQQNQQNEDNQDKNDQNEDQQNKDQQNEDKNDDQKDEQPQDKQQDKKEDQQNQQQPQEPKDEISQEEAKRILEALKNNEAELQKKMREQKTKKTNVEKDW